MGGTGRIFMPGCSRLALGSLQLGVSLGGGLTPGHVLRVYAVRTSVLEDDLSQPLRKPWGELLVVRLEARIGNVTASQNSVLGGGDLEEE